MKSLLKRKELFIILILTSCLSVNQKENLITVKNYDGNFECVNQQGYTANYYKCMQTYLTERYDARIKFLQDQKSKEKFDVDYILSEAEKLPSKDIKRGIGLISYVYKNSTQEESKVRASETAEAKLETYFLEKLDEQLSKNKIELPQGEEK